jgi:hypothetical protein
MKTRGRKRWSPHLALRGPSRTGGFLSHSLRLGETHASAAVRAQGWVWERNEVREFVRWTVVVAIGVVPLITLAADPLPTRRDFNRYQGMLNRSFAIATVIPTASADSAKDLYFASIGCAGKDCVVTLRSVTDKNFKQEVPVKRPNERDFNNIYIDLRQ